MSRTRGRQLTVVAVAVVAAALLDAFAFHGFASRETLALASRPATFLYAHVSAVREGVRAVTDFRQLADENAALREQVADLTHRTADAEDLARQNAELRDALGLPARGITVQLDASVFQVQQSPTGASALINRGTADGVARGDAVVTSQGVLVGVVGEVHERSATVQLSTDPGFEATARVRGTETSAIVRGTGDGLRLDLVVQGDQVTEGDTVVSAGTDLLLPSLVIGTVAHVDERETALFKDVRVNPAWDHLLTGTVFVLRGRW